MTDLEQMDASRAEGTSGMTAEPSTTLQSDDAATHSASDEGPSPFNLFRQALVRGARLLSSSDPEKAKLFKRGVRLVNRSSERRAMRPMAVLLTFMFLMGAFAPFLMASGLAYDASLPLGSNDALNDSAPAGAGDDFQIGAASANLTTTTSTNKIYVWSEEYVIKVDYSTSYVDYKICPYFCTDFIRYRRVNPQYAGDGTYDVNKNELSVSMTISSWGRSGNRVWFRESCAEFSLNQTFSIYRDYFELNVTYAPGTRQVTTSYFIGLYSATGSIYSMLDIGTGRYNRYVPGMDEKTPDSRGLGGWYPSLNMFAPACDMRAPGKNLGVEWGYNETSAYLYSPIWMKDCGTGGASAFTMKFSSKNSVVLNPSLGTPETFHMFVRPYKYTDGKDRGYDVGYAQWVAPLIAKAYGNHDTPIFPLAAMGLNSYSTTFRTWLESSQIKLATYSNNPDQINWNYKSSQVSNTGVYDPARVPKSWQLYIAPDTPMTVGDNAVICNAVSGPYNVPGTYRWQLINNDSYMSWWTGTKGVFWDEMNLWTADNRLRNDYQYREDFLYEGYLSLIKESYASGYWDYVIANPFSSMIHMAIAADACLIEGYEASSSYNIGMLEHVWSTMNFVNNMPIAYRPNILVYQNYASSNVNDQEDVYSALLGAAKYNFHLTLVCYDSYDSQMHNWYMAESMFKAMGCTRNSDVRTVTVDTLDLAASTSLSTNAQMVVLKGGAKSTITESSNLASFIITNLHATSNDFDLRVPGGGYFTPGSGAQTISPMTYTSDGYAKFSGRVDAEKTSTITRNENIQVYQRNSGSASVSLTSIGPSADLTVQSTGGTTEIVLRGFAAGRTYNILVDSVVVEQRTATSVVSITISRSFGSSDRVQTQLASAADTYPPHVSGSNPASGAAAVPVGAQVRITFNESMDKSSAQSAFSLTGSSLVAGTFTWETGDTAMVFTPSQPLQYLTAYVAQVSTSAKDVAGNYLSPAFSTSFTTESQSLVVVVPSAPQGLTATGGTKSVSLSWSAPSSNGGASITAYKIYRGTAPEGQSTTPIATLGNVTSYQDIGLLDGTNYYYKVSAVNSAGEGTKSSEARVTTLSVPGAPGTPSAVASYRSVSLAWSAPSSNGGSAITGYRIYRGLSSQSLALVATLGNVLAYTDSGLSNGTTYYYKVSAINIVGEGTSSAVSSVTTSSVVPAAPVDLHSICSPDSISLSWSEPASDGGSAITGYMVYRGNSSGQLTLLASLGDVLAYVDSGLPFGVTYYYQVSAVSGVGEGARSVEVQGTTSLEAPSAPQSLQATSLDGKVRLDWSAPENDGGAPVQRYQIYRAVGLGQMELVAVISPVLFYDDAGLSNGVEYRYQVSAGNSAGEGALSEEAMAKPMGPPGVPLNLQALPANEKVALSWASPSDLGGSAIAGYNVYRGDSPSTVSLLVSLGVVTSYDDTSLSNGHQFYYSISAVNGVGEGDACSAVSCIPGYFPSAPQTLRATPSDGLISLSWAAPLSDNGHEIIGYNVYRGPSSENLALLTSLASVLVYGDHEVSNGQTYYYRVTGINSMGEGAFSAWASAKPATLPDAPTQLVAVGGVGMVDLAWVAPASNGGDAISSYAIYRETPLSPLTQIATSTATSYHDIGLPMSTLCHYEVRASNSVGQGPAASASAATAGLPGSPGSLSGSPSEFGISLSWSAPSQNGGSGITFYNIYRGPSLDAMSLVGTAAGTAYPDVGLSPGTRYYYAITAVNAVGEGLASSIKDLTTLVSVPSAPRNIHANSGTERIELGWEAPSSNGGTSITKYHVYRGTSESQLSYLAETTLTTYTDVDVFPGQTYYYRVAAVNVIGEGGASSEVSSLAVALPSAPASLQAVKGKSSVSLTWNAPTDTGGGSITGYVIYRGTSPDSLSKLATVGAVLKYTDSSLPKADTAYYSISAVNSAGEGGQSDLAFATLIKKSSAPRSLAISDQDGKLLLSWDPPEDDGGSEITSYAIYRRSADGNLTKVAMVNSTSLLDMGLTNGVTYSYSIAAINTAGEGELTDLASGKPFGLPSSPPYLNATPYDKMVLLKWGAPMSDGGDAVIGYDIFVVDGDEERYLGQVAADINSYVCNDLRNGVNYVFRVAAVNAAGQSDRCSVVGTPISAVIPSVADSGAIDLTGSTFILTSVGAIALLGVAVGMWRYRTNKAASRRPSQKGATAALKGPPVRVQVVTARMIKASATPVPTSAPRPEEVSFERTLRDLETTNRIL
ncbi:MAG: fibronectin type III domain-containing protein [Methanomassiliicoccales archaeon]|nr:fibronectin type III domain-containing protein [Methanomassiliicoccales archaeon]